VSHNRSIRCLLTLVLVLGTTVGSTGDSIHPVSERGEELIRNRRYDAFKGAHYRVKTDDPRIKTRVAVDLLDAFYGFFESSWESPVELDEDTSHSMAFLFYSSNSYRSAVRDSHNCVFSSSQSDHDPRLDVTAHHTETGFPEFADSLIHGAAHQQLARRFFHPETPRPTWLLEGLAGYFSGTRVNDSLEFQAGRTGRKSIQLFDEPLPGTSRFRARFTRRFNRLMNEGQFENRPSIDALLKMETPLRFSAGNREGNYVLSWALVHYLLQGDDGAYRESFMKYLQALRTREASATDDGPDLLEMVGLSARVLEERVLTHGRSVKFR